MYGDLWFIVNACRLEDDGTATYVGCKKIFLGNFPTLEVPADFMARQPECDVEKEHCYFQMEDMTREQIRDALNK